MPLLPPVITATFPSSAPIFPSFDGLWSVPDIKQSLQTLLSAKPADKVEIEPR
jgi:hypothetical protein